MHIKFLPLLSVIVILLAVGLTLFKTQPADACINLDPGRGDAVWFYRTCSISQPGTLASWDVGLVSSRQGAKSLGIQVENAYPGYQLQCDLYFANTGQFPIGVDQINLINRSPHDLILTAVEGPGMQGKVIQPCGSTPAWGKNPSRLPSSCWSKIHVTLTLGAQVKEKIDLPFSIQVKLEQKNSKRH